MIITGFPRAGTSLLLLLIAGSCTNKEVFYKNESTKFARKGDMISKDPFAGIRIKKGMVEPLWMIRHPMAVMTSTTHTRFRGEAAIRWEKNRKPVPYGLKSHYEAIPDDAKLWRYEDLCRAPNDFQRMVAQDYGLEFDKDWDTWPWPEFKIPKYWNQSLGKPRPIHPAREWEGEIGNDEIREACERLGY